MTDDKPNLIDRVFFFRFGLAAFLIIVLCATVFYLGGVNACKQGEGRIMGLKCVDVIDVGACFDEEQDRYLVPLDEEGNPLITNITVENLT